MRTVPTQEAIDLAKQMKICFIEISALNQHNLKFLFDVIIRYTLNFHLNANNNSNSNCCLRILGCADHSNNDADDDSDIDANTVPDELKFVVLGAGAVGKSASTIMFVTRSFLDEYDPTIEDSYRKTLHLSRFRKNIIFDILDTAGQEDFSSMQDQWMREGQGFVVMYSITSRASFEEAMSFINKIAFTKGEDHSNIPIVFVGNKSDLDSQREVTQQQARSYAESQNLVWFETSAKIILISTECSLIWPNNMQKNELIKIMDAQLENQMILGINPLIFHWRYLGVIKQANIH